jgi:hypothetical protein
MSQGHYQPLPPYYRREPERERAEAAAVTADLRRKESKRRSAMTAYSVMSGVALVGAIALAATTMKPQLPGGLPPSPPDAKAGAGAGGPGTSSDSGHSAGRSGSAGASAAGASAAGLSAQAVFSAATMKVGPRSYDRKVVTSGPCNQGVSPALASLLTQQGCKSLLRATYTSGTSAIGLGVAVLPSASAAAAAAQPSAGGEVIPYVTGSGVAAFCTKGDCSAGQSADSGYALFSVVDRTDGTHPAAADAKTANQAALAALRAEVR